MNSQSSPPTASAGRPAIGLAVTALVCGICSFILSFLLIGALLGLIGLIAGMIHLRRPEQLRGMAVSGLILSILGIAASAGFLTFYYNVYQRAMSLRRSTAGQIGGLQIWEGTPAPDVTVTTLDGHSIKLSALRGKRVVLDRWATWCAPCVQEIRHFNHCGKPYPMTT
jgi:thiol:disulfide interchange protein